MKVRKLVSPAIYKHFKNKYYATMGVAKRIDTRNFPKDYYDSDKYTIFIAEYTEAKSKDDLEVTLIVIDGEFYHLRGDLDDLVIYKSLYDGHIAYARDYGMFLSEVDRVKHPNVEQKYRFELVTY